jgi:hypothetical protein
VSRLRSSRRQNSRPARINATVQNKGAIGLPTAIVLFCLLFAGAAYSLKGNVRIAVLAVIALLLVKSCLHYIRDRQE